MLSCLLLLADLDGLAVEVQHLGLAGGDALLYRLVQDICVADW